MDWLDPDIDWELSNPKKYAPLGNLEWKSGRARCRGTQKKRVQAATTFRGENYSINVGQFSLFSVRQHNIAVWWLQLLLSQLVVPSADHDEGLVMMRLLMLFVAVSNYCSFH